LRHFDSARNAAARCIADPGAENGDEGIARNSHFVATVNRRMTLLLRGLRLARTYPLIDPD